MGLNGSALSSEKCQDGMWPGAGELPAQGTPRLSPEGGRESAGGMKGGSFEQIPGRFSSTPVPHLGFIKLFFFSYSPLPQCLSEFFFQLASADDGQGVHILTRPFTSGGSHHGPTRSTYMPCSFCWPLDLDHWVSVLFLCLFTSGNR